MRNFFGEPDHRPLDASKVCPTIGTPKTPGATTFRGFREALADELPAKSAPNEKEIRLTTTTKTVGRR
jgi:hypothetical protein